MGGRARLDQAAGMHRRLRPRRILVVGAAVLVAAACQPLTAGAGGAGPGHPRPVRLNDIQVLASHNSYHVEPEPALESALHAFLGPAADAFEYTHRPLADELDAGGRQVELDVFTDPGAGGRYAHPKAVALFGVAPPAPAVAGPGLKVFHVQEVDFRSTCPTLVDCLTQVRD